SLASTIFTVSAGSPLSSSSMRSRPRFPSLRTTARYQRAAFGRVHTHSMPNMTSFTTTRSRASSGVSSTPPSMMSLTLRSFGSGSVSLCGSSTWGEEVLDGQCLQCVAHEERPRESLGALREHHTTTLGGEAQCLRTDRHHRPDAVLLIHGVGDSGVHLDTHTGALVHGLAC